MIVLEDSYRSTSVVFVCPLSRDVFSKLLNTYPRLSTSDLKEKVIELTNCIPRELVKLSTFVDALLGPISEDDLQNWIRERTQHYFSVAEAYIKSCDPYGKERFYKALLQTFLGSTSTANFEWGFLDLGLIFRSKYVRTNTVQNHILCRPAQNTLLDLFRELPLSEDVKNRALIGSISGGDFEKALWQQLICTPKPIVLNATDLVNKNLTTVTLNFIDYDTIKLGKLSLGNGHESVLARGLNRYPRFDFMLGRMFFQVSISDFGKHNNGTAKIELAFDKDENDTNQIERYLNDMYSNGHSAVISEGDKRFIVMKDGEPVPGFRIVYIRGSHGTPNHDNKWIKALPDVLHITFNEVLDILFRNMAA